MRWGMAESEKEKKEDTNAKQQKIQDKIKTARQSERWSQNCKQQHTTSVC